MKIVESDMVGAGDFRAFYNSRIGTLPHRYPVSRHEFEWGCIHKPFDEQPYTNLGTEQFLCAVEGEEILGIAHVSVAEEEAGRIGQIRYLDFVPGHRRIGQELLVSAEARLTDVETIRAFCPDYLYRFFFNCYGLPDKWLHVTSILGLNGYSVSRREILLVQEGGIAPSQLDPPEKVGRIEWETTESRGRTSGLNLRVYDHADKVIGVCYTRAGSHFQLNKAAERVCFVAWLNVRDALRGLGWGRFIFLTALNEIKQRGFTTVLISTNEKNHRAQAFYANYGFSMVETLSEFSKGLSAPRTSDGR
ncbi:MAG: GNAT family N-acetyltransferase [Gemmatimonadetes bacterium]|nr:GNAT family N-acetyltransferase [Gemmatimonadota bacterium]